MFCANPSQLTLLDGPIARIVSERRHRKDRGPDGTRQRARRMSYRAALLLVTATATALYGCDGGQSGTDAPDSMCATRRWVAALPSTPILLGKLVGVHSLEGTWANGRKVNRLRVDVQLGARLPVADEDGCGPVTYEVTAHVTTNDGLVDA